MIRIWITFLVFSLMCYSSITYSMDIINNENIEISLSGSYKNLFTMSETSLKENFHSDLNRLRLDFDLKIKDSIRIKTILDNEVLLGNILDTDDFLFIKKIKDDKLFDLDKVVIDNSDLFWRLNLYRLYLAYSTEKVNLVVGRQRVNWGSGRIWNPIDLFNPSSPLSIDRDNRVGVDAVNYEYFFGSLNSVNVVYAPREESIKTSLAARINTNLKGYDLSLIFGEFRSNRVLGFDFVGNIQDWGFRGELTLTDPEVGEDFIRLLLSWDYTFPSSLFILFEYLYNGGNLERLIDNAIPTTFTREIITKNKNFIGSDLGYDISPLLRCDIIFIYDIDGNSVFIGPTLNYNVISSVDLTLGGQIYSGSKNSEFGELSEAVYFSISWYF